MPSSWHPTSLHLQRKGERSETRIQWFHSVCIFYFCACMEGFLVLFVCLDFVLVLLWGWNQKCFNHIYYGTKHNRIIMNKSGQVNKTMKTLKHGSEILKKREMIRGEMNQWLTSLAAISKDTCSVLITTCWFTTTYNSNSRVSDTIELGRHVGKTLIDIKYKSLKHKKIHKWTDIFILYMVRVVLLKHLYYLSNT